MSDYDNGFRRAQQMYDAQEEPTEDRPEPKPCPVCGKEMMVTCAEDEETLFWICDCGHEEKVR